MAQNNDLQPLLDVRQNQLALVFASSDALDTKHIGLFAANVAVLIFAAQSLEQFSFVLAAGTFYLLSSVFNVLALWPANYRGASVDLGEHPEYLALSERKLVLQLLADTGDAIDHNTILNERKSARCIVAFALTIVGTIILVGGILYI